jgi:hypothetical protein
VRITLDAKQSRKMNKLYLLLSPVLLAGCANDGHWQTVTMEHKNGLTIIHHRKRGHDGAIDHIETINAKGVVTEAEVHVYDLGRLPDGNGGVHEAHRFYKTVQDSYPRLDLGSKTSSGPRTVYTPPNYVPPPQDQRINDAVTEARQAKQKLDETQQKIADRISEDNVLRGEVQNEKDENQKLRDQLRTQLNGAMDAHAKPTEAQQAAEGDVDALKKWGLSAQP